MVIKNNLYHISSYGFTGQFICFDNDDQAIEYSFNFRENGNIRLIRLLENGTKERIKVYTSDKWKELQILITLNKKVKTIEALLKNKNGYIEIIDKVYNPSNDEWFINNKNGTNHLVSNKIYKKIKYQLIKVKNK